MSRKPKPVPRIDVDVLIVGAGISGIGVACRLQMNHPGLTLRILDRRERIGGTWDLFRYPGIRSDYDMYTFGYDFKPWTDSKVLADGAAIRDYLQETADDFRLGHEIDFGMTVTSADWSSERQRWTVIARDRNGEEHRYIARFLVGCTGYYDYDQGYRPQFPNEDAFEGRVIHPQHWPEDLDYAGKSVAVIGSGATAVTLVPNMADTAASVTMIQRSPTYIIPMPSENQLVKTLSRYLPDTAVYRIVRSLTLGFGQVSYAAMRTFPKQIKRAIINMVGKQLKPGIDVAHFTPTYNPWDQRMCVVPGGDLFTALNEDRAEIVTDTIAGFTPTGIQLDSGRHVDADIIITATGLNVKVNGDIELRIDGEPIDISSRLTYKAVLIDRVPNAAYIFGYTNASWTLKVDIAAEYLSRLISYMDSHGYAEVQPQAPAGETTDGSVFGNLTSGYVQRGADKLPRQGRRGPWVVRHSYWRDARMLRKSSIDDGSLRFTPKVRPDADLPDEASARAALSTA